MPSLTLAFSPGRSVSAVDTEIAGAVMRVVLDGAPKLVAKTPSEALQELRVKHDDFRRFLVAPPRGHPYLNACILLPPFSADAHRTAIIAEHFGYAPVAGTALLAAAAALVETGEVAAETPHATIFFDTSHALMSVVATVSDGRCTSARWFTEPPSVVAGDLRIDIRGRSIQAMVVSTGLPYVVARQNDLGVRLDDPLGLEQAGVLLSRIAAEELPLEQAGVALDAEAYLVMIVGDLDGFDRVRAPHVKAVWISPTGVVSDVPAGTGALSVCAYFTETGELPVGALLTVGSPSGKKLRTRIGASGAMVEGEPRVIALVDLV